jgi:hypothetical protein
MINDRAITISSLLALFIVAGCTSTSGKPNQPLGDSKTSGSVNLPTIALNPDQQKCEELITAAPSETGQKWVEVEEFMRQFRTQNGSIVSVRRKYLDPEVNKIFLNGCVKTQEWMRKADREQKMQSWDAYFQHFAEVKTQVETYCGGKSKCLEHAVKRP